jgi:hypothetical protein
MVIGSRSVADVKALGCVALPTLSSSTSRATGAANAQSTNIPPTLTVAAAAHRPFTLNFKFQFSYF